MTINVRDLLALVLIWSYGCISSSPGLDLSIFVGCLYVLLSLTFKDSKLEIRFPNGYWTVLGLFGIFIITPRIFSLQFSLGGDELWHAEKASILAVKAVQWLALAPVDSVWAGYLRDLPVLDLSRLMFLPIILIFTLLLFIYQNISRISNGYKKEIAMFLLFSMIFHFSTELRSHLDYHPPMRLFPVFLGQSLFGMNSVGYRMPGLICLSFFLTSLYFYIKTEYPELPKWYLGLICISVAFLPPVFYSADQVEPSIWAFLIWTGVLILLSKSLSANSKNSLILCGLLVGIGSLFRQTLMFVWPLVGICFLVLITRKKISWLESLKVFTTGLLVLPYLLTARALNHGALGDVTIMDQIRKIVESVPELAFYVFNSHLPLWSLIGFFLVAICIWQKLYLILYLPVAMFLYHLPLSPTLWGIGRYQTEYISSFLAFAMFLALPRLLIRFPKMAIWSSALLVLGIFSTIEVNSNLSLDTQYKSWPQMRITTSSSFPIQKALRFVKTHQLTKDFLIVGGSPFHYQMTAWLGGFSPKETADWYTRQEEFQKLIRQSLPASALEESIHRMKIKFLIVLNGPMREVLHRGANINELIFKIQNQPQGSPIYRIERTFGPEHGGFLDIYRIAMGNENGDQK